jgi:hypothetical protein|tara:strand:- start:628 stop:837 length:210 start_codon:yes stop_codon:yes gene_type:complete
MNISIELINAILNYLSKQPFNEVNGLVGQLMLEVRKAQEGNQQEMSFPVEQSDDSSNTSKKDTKKNATD